MLIQLLALQVVYVDDFIVRTTTIESKTIGEGFADIKSIEPGEKIEINIDSEFDSSYHQFQFSVFLQTTAVYDVYLVANIRFTTQSNSKISVCVFPTRNLNSISNCKINFTVFTYTKTVQCSLIHQYKPTILNITNVTLNIQLGSFNTTILTFGGIASQLYKSTLHISNCSLDLTVRTRSTQIAAGGIVGAANEVQIKLHGVTIFFNLLSTHNDINQLMWKSNGFNILQDVNLPPFILTVDDNKGIARLKNEALIGGIAGIIKSSRNSINNLRINFNVKLDNFKVGVLNKFVELQSMHLVYTQILAFLEEEKFNETVDNFVGDNLPFKLKHYLKQMITTVQPKNISVVDFIGIQYNDFGIKFQSEIQNRTDLQKLVGCTTTQPCLISGKPVQQIVSIFLKQEFEKTNLNNNFIGSLYGSLVSTFDDAMNVFANGYVGGDCHCRTSRCDQFEMQHQGTFQEHIDQYNQQMQHPDWKIYKKPSFHCDDSIVYLCTRGETKYEQKVGDQFYQSEKELTLIGDILADGKRPE
ncbi:Hypothetical_protein [Hexamita inflata]|uniref:Hypothetical_protein n=1 Tax=Hexamita inflata TaxID=28002 RepID=A0AA86R5U8_9EUKA|nr:Hypothetical protein HINF_LOCUS54187 [Hexamita inflata]